MYKDKKIYNLLLRRGYNQVSTTSDKQHMAYYTVIYLTINQNAEGMGEKQG